MRTLQISGFITHGVNYVMLLQSLLILEATETLHRYPEFDDQQLKSSNYFILFIFLKKMLLLQLVRMLTDISQQTYVH